MKNCKALLFFVFAALLLTTSRSAAQSGSAEIAEMQRRMMEMQRRMMQEFQRTPFGSFFDLPGNDSDSTDSFFKFDTSFLSDGKDSYFKFDTSFSDGSTMHFFRFSPSGSDSTGISLNFDRFFGQTPQGQRNFPKDDGNERLSEEDLLPEERLRQAENGQGIDQKTPEKSSKPGEKEAPKKPKIKTTRI